MTIIDLPDLDAYTPHPAATTDENALLAWAHNNPIDRPGLETSRGRYRAVAPGDTTERSYSRASSYGGVIEDAGNLEKWRRRILLRGLHADDTLRERILEAAADGDNPNVDHLADTALKRGGQWIAADCGTAIHLACEHIDEGRALENFPERYRPDIDAYQQLIETHQLAPELVEAQIYTPLPDGEAVIGRIDRLYRTSDGRLVVGDIKTGTGVAWIGNAVQAAIYALATHQWVDDAWAELPAIDQTEAFIAHLPLGAGTAELTRIDLEQARQRLHVAQQVRKTRRGIKAMFTPRPTPGAVTTKVADIPFPDTPPAGRDEWITGRITTLVASTAARELLAEYWPDDCPKKAPWTPEQQALVTPVLDAVETRVQAPFPHSDPEAPSPEPHPIIEAATAAAAPPAPAFAPPPIGLNAATPDWPAPDNGGPADQKAIESAVTANRSLDKNKRALVEAWSAQSIAAGNRWGRATAADPMTARSVALIEAACAAARHLWDDYEPELLTRAAIAHITATDLDSAWPTGPLVAALNIEQAEWLQELAASYGAGDETATAVLGAAVTRA